MKTGRRRIPAALVIAAGRCSSWETIAEIEAVFVSGEPLDIPASP